MEIKIHPINAKKDYEKALEVVDRLWDAKPNPIEAIKFRMEQMGLGKADIANILGGANRVSEILHKKRKLSLRMIRNLHDKLKIPYESLIPP